MSLRKGIVVGVIVTALVCFLGTPPVVWAEDFDKPTGTEITFDLMIARPLGIVSLAAGTSIFIASLPFAAVAGSVKNTGNALVGEPYRFTFIRDLGEY
jgi:hypothetical protein